MTKKGCQKVAFYSRFVSLLALKALGTGSAKEGLAF
jgi:hypothetical protein